MKYTAKKYNAQRVHFKKRFKERVGKSINRFEIREILNDIGRHKYPIYEKQSNRIYLFIINIDDKDFIIFYDKFRKNLVTIIDYNENDEFIFRGNYNG